LVRFYQTWVITKDTQYREPVPRTLSVQVPDVQISIVFLIIAVLIAILILLGISIYVFSMVRHWDAMAKVPQSKLDWILQSAQTRNEESSPPNSSGNAFLDCSVTSSLANASSHTPSKTSILRADFENAKYGSHLQERSPEGWQLWQQHGRARYAQEDTTAPPVRSPAFQNIPRKLLASVYENKTPLLSVDLAENDDFFSHTSGRSTVSEQGLKVARANDPLVPRDS
jgi:energy-converting hydrogenase Eha subunit E